MTSEVQVQTPQPIDTNYYRYKANCAEFNAIMKKLIKEKDVAAIWRGVDRMDQLNNELEALEK